MPVFYTPIPQNLRVGLANVSGSVFINNRTRDSGHFRDPYPDHEGETSAKHKETTLQPALITGYTSVRLLVIVTL